MHNSNLSLSQWASAFYILSARLQGVSSLKLHRDLGMTQKTAWHLAQRIRNGLEWFWAIGLTADTRGHPGRGGPAPRAVRHPARGGPQAHTGPSRPPVDAVMTPLCSVPGQVHNADVGLPLLLVNRPWCGMLLATCLINVWR